MGKHHEKRATAVARMAIVPSAAAAVLVAASGAASATPNQLPSQGGVTSAPSQGGVTSAPSQGGVTAAPAQPEQVYWVEPPARYRNLEYQPLPNYDYGTDTYTAPADYVAPAEVQNLRLPTYVEPTAPIIAPRETLRIGTFHAPQPNWITDGDLTRTNNTSAIVEAEVSTFWRSLGIETDRASRLAAAQLGMGASGALVGAGVLGGLGALVGGAAGTGVASYNLAPVAGLVLPVIGYVSGITVATAVGAAVLGVPAAVTGAVAGGAAGALVGTGMGAGDLGEPRDISIPDIDQPAITEQTRQTLARWETTPLGDVVASTVRETASSTPTVDRQARDLVAAQPGGAQVLEQIDAGLTTFVAESSLGVVSEMIGAAVGDGIRA